MLNNLSADLNVLKTIYVSITGLEVLAYNLNRKTITIYNYLNLVKPIATTARW
jgi:hypothetical protein